MNAPGCFVLILAAVLVVFLWKLLLIYWLGLTVLAFAAALLVATRAQRQSWHWGLSAVLALIAVFLLVEKFQAIQPR